MDELGVLLAGHKKNAFWYGSQLTIDEARKLAPYNNATGLQVTIAVLGAMVWAMEHPDSGLMEPDELDHKRILEIARPYLGTVSGTYTDWSPLSDRESLFPEDLDLTDPCSSRTCAWFEPGHPGCSAVVDRGDDIAGFLPRDAHRDLLIQPLASSARASGASMLM